MEVGKLAQKLLKKYFNFNTQDPSWEEQSTRDGIPYWSSSGDEISFLCPLIQHSLL
jgi:hypothetical protein